VGEREGRPARVARRRYIVLLLLVCVVGLAVFGWLNRPRDEPARATVDEAIRSFRAQEDVENGAGAGERKLGVYRYQTRGSESVQSPISDTTHDYDGVSTIVVSAGRCGQVERWQVLEGRWSEGESCPGPHGDRFTAATEFHEFFGFEQKDSFHCRGIAMPRPLPKRGGESFSSSCSSGDSSVSSSSRVTGFELVTVAGKPYPAIHIESHSELEGEVSGTARREEWRRRSDGLLLRRSASAETDTGLGGGTHYTEQYTISLLDPKPRR
jgi:hypothetical protein